MAELNAKNSTNSYTYPCILVSGDEFVSDDEFSDDGFAPDSDEISAVAPGPLGTPSKLKFQISGNRHHECAICQERFTSPRLLPCFHTFCLACLQQLVTKQKQTSSFNCPICRMPTKIPTGGVEGFQVNFYIEAEVEGHQVLAAKKKCDICGEKSVKHKCCDCDQLMCESCTNLHAVFASSKTHTVLNLQTDTTRAGEAAVTRDRYCTTHKEEKLRFFCTKCSSVICRDCKLTSHEGHASVDLGDKSKAAKSLIQQVTEISLALETNMKQALQDCKFHRMQIYHQKQFIIHSLKSRAAELQKEIEEALQETIKRVESYTEDIGATAAKSAETMEHELACFTSQREYSQSLLQKGSDADVLEMPSHFKEFFGQNVRFDCDFSQCKIATYTNEIWKESLQHTLNQQNKSGRQKGRCTNCGSVSSVQTDHKQSVKLLATEYFGTVSKTRPAKSNNAEQICKDIKRIQQISAYWR